MSTNTAEMDALKARLKSTWMSGDYAHFATYLADGAMDFLASINVSPGAKVLDVACGAGQTAIPMARKGINVTGVDIATNLIEAARKRARDEGLSIRFDEGDAEELPYEDASFDVVISLIGAMFAPQPQKVAAEMARVCRPGGRIIMGNWTPGGFVGQMFKIVAAHVPPPAKGHLREGQAWIAQALAAPMSITDRILWAVATPLLWAGGWAITSQVIVDADRQHAMRRDFVELWAQHNQSANGTIVLEAEYLIVDAVRRHEADETIVDRNLGNELVQSRQLIARPN